MVPPGALPCFLAAAISAGPTWQGFTPHFGQHAGPIIRLPLCLPCAQRRLEGLGWSGSGSEGEGEGEGEEGGRGEAGAVRQGLREQRQRIVEAVRHHGWHQVGRVMHVSRLCHV